VRFCGGRVRKAREQERESQEKTTRNKTKHGEAVGKEIRRTVGSASETARGFLARSNAALRRRPRDLLRRIGPVPGRALAAARKTNKVLFALGQKARQRVERGSAGGEEEKREERRGESNRNRHRFCEEFLRLEFCATFFPFFSLQIHSNVLE
jgi:hypothetical protein